jgi:uncharacterized protein YjbI with pentapeptide repeats
VECELLIAITLTLFFVVVIMDSKSSYQTPDYSKVREIWVTPYEKQLLSGQPQKNGDNADPLPSSGCVPQSLPDDWVYENIKDAIYHCRRIFYIYLGILCYTLLTISTSPQLDFFMGQEIIMPVMDARIPLSHYLGLAPLLLIGFFVYKQLYLYKTNKLINYAIEECKALNEDNGTICRDKAKKCTLNSMCNRHLSRLYPWIIIYCRFLDKGPVIDTRKDRLGVSVGKAQQLFVSFSLWWLLPITLMMLSGFVIKKHSVFLSAYMMGVTCFGIAVVAFFWHLQQNLMNRTGTLLSSIRAISIFATTVILVMLLAGLNIVAFRGKLPWEHYYLRSEPQKKVPLQDIWGDLKELPLKVLVTRHFVFADLNNETIAKKSENEPGYWIDLENRHFAGANLSRAKLKRANIKYSFLNNASLEEAFLEEANLDDTRANGANFSGAILTKATLSNSKLVKADFSNAKLQKAILAGAVLDEADFTFADLSGANLSNSQVKDASFLNANLQSAWLVGVRGMRPDQITRASNYQLAYYTIDWLKKLDLPLDNNFRVETKRFAEYQFEDAILNDADLNRADLTGARFRNANLRRANLQGAKLHEAELLNADFQEANLKGVSISDIEQFSTVKSLYKAVLDPGLKDKLKKHYPHLFVNPYLE